ncbi:hypothetical protein PSAB6_340185 [Paraburkholderia sabiae]|nr:hypothetical protein PSAB6_340185 [Paraburkholderia sabiae]
MFSKTRCSTHACFCYRGISSTWRRCSRPSRSKGSETDRLAVRTNGNSRPLRRPSGARIRPLPVIEYRVSRVQTLRVEIQPRVEMRIPGMRNTLASNGHGRGSCQVEHGCPITGFATFHGLWRSYVAGEEVLHSMEWSRKVRKGLPPKGTGWEGLCEAWGIYHPRLSHISGHANDSSPPFSAGAS